MFFFHEINLNDFFKKNIDLKNKFDEKFKIKKDLRLTNFGEFLRTTSLDKPQNF